MRKIEDRYNELMIELWYIEEEVYGLAIEEMLANSIEWLSTYYDGTHLNGSELREECPQIWKSHVAKLKRFIKRCEKAIAER